MNIMSAISDDKIQMSQLSMIMTVFASIHIDCDLYNLTILEDNVNTKIMEECYKRNAFYMLSSGPVIDKKTGEVCILLDFYKKATTDPLVFLDDVKKENAEILGYLYLKELIGIAQKNYRNKFTLANRARVYLYEHNPNIPGNMRDQAGCTSRSSALGVYPDGGRGDGRFAGSWIHLDTFTEELHLPRQVYRRTDDGHG